jgi:DNA-binding beta-propeller fold protein YncE
MPANLTLRLLLLAFCLANLPPAPAWAQVDVEAAQVNLREAGQAYRDGDMTGFTSSLETALSLNPASLATRYNLACAYARTDRNDEALRLLQGLVDARVDYGMGDDPDLVSLHGNAEFDDMLRTLDNNLQPVSASTRRLSLDQLGLIPEGIAIDQATSRTFLGSMRNGDIFVIDAAGQMSKFASVADDEKLAAIGLFVDAEKEVLWAIGATFNLVEGFDPDAPARSGVFGFNLTTGQLEHQYMAAEPGNGFNDVTVAPSGDLYLSGGTLSIVRDGSDVIQPVKTTQKIFGSNGVAITPDGNRLFVTSYPVGIATIDLSSGETAWLEAPGGATLYGIDGLYWYEGDLVGVQNGVNPWRLVRLQLNQSQTAITNIRMIEFANESITPTTGAIVDDIIHYVGQGPRPEVIPGHFAENMAPFLGETIVMTAPLN